MIMLCAKYKQNFVSIDRGVFGSRVILCFWWRTEHDPNLSKFLYHKDL